MKKFVLLFSIIALVLSTSFTANAQKIKCSNEPYLPDQTWQVINPPQKAEIELNLANITLVKLIDKINDQSSDSGLSSCFLDYLLQHQELIPKEWQGKTIVFSGTRYSDPSGLLLYRNLYWDGTTWDWNRTYFTDVPQPNTYYVIKN